MLRHCWDLQLKMCAHMKLDVKFSLPAGTSLLDQEDTCGPNSQTSAAHVDVCI